MKIRVVESTYKERPVLQIFDDDSKPEYKDVPILNLGLRKAKAVIAVQDQISDFINKYKRK